MVGGEGRDGDPRRGAITQAGTTRVDVGVAA